MGWWGEGRGRRNRPEKTGSERRIPDGSAAHKEVGRLGRRRASPSKPNTAHPALSERDRDLGRLLPPSKYRVLVREESNTLCLHHTQA